jgi:hypothetical protein
MSVASLVHSGSTEQRQLRELVLAALGAVFPIVSCESCEFGGHGNNVSVLCDCARAIEEARADQGLRFEQTSCRTFPQGTSAGLALLIGRVTDMVKVK